MAVFSFFFLCGVNGVCGYLLFTVRKYGFLWKISVAAEFPVMEDICLYMSFLISFFS